LRRIVAPQADAVITCSGGVEMIQGCASSHEVD
jgi:hypothetical protein